MQQVSNIEELTHFYPLFLKKARILILCHWKTENNQTSLKFFCSCFSLLFFTSLSGDWKQIFSAAQSRLQSNTNFLYHFDKNPNNRNCFWTTTIPYKNTYVRRCLWIVLFHTGFRSNVYKLFLTAISSLCSNKQQRAQLPAEALSSWRLCDCLILLKTFSETFLKCIRRDVLIKTLQFPQSVIPLKECASL